MASTTGSERVTDVSDLVVVDADGHAQETFEDIRAHLDDGHERFEQFLDRAPAPGTEMDLYASPTPMYLYEKIGNDGEDASLYDANQLRQTAELADEIGIDRAVINPTLNINLDFVKQMEYAVGMMNGYNNWLVSELDHHPSMVGNLVVAPQDPHHAAEEIDRVAGESDIVGVQLHGTGLVPPAGHETYEPIYEAAGDHGLPVCMHTSGAGMKSFPEQSIWAETYAEDHVTQHPFAHMWNVTSLLCRGVPERYPETAFVLQEAGIGYVPYLVKRLDTAYHEFGDELPALTRPPSEYLSESFYWTTQPLGHTAETPRHLAWLVELVGPENLMFSADIPHPDFDTPEELFDRIRPYFDADALRDMMGGNAVEVFDI
jgi:predicted TIM-barrel fold metal-dependent hydrolase